MPRKFTFRAPGCMPLSYFGAYNEFANACDIQQGNINDRPNFDSIRLARNLVQKEYTETQVALDSFMAAPTYENMAEVADGIADSIYVLCQLARSLGVPLDEVFDEVHRSNMLKVGVDGKVKRREDGKILKPEGWTPPRIIELLYEYSNKLSVEQSKNGGENWK